MSELLKELTRTRLAVRAVFEPPGFGWREITEDNERLRFAFRSIDFLLAALQAAEEQKQRQPVTGAHHPDQSANPNGS